MNKKQHFCVAFYFYCGFKKTRLQIEKEVVLYTCK